MNGSSFSVLFLLTGVVVIGVLILGILLIMRMKRTSGADPDEQMLDELKEQIVWKAMAQNGRVTPEEMVAHAGRPQMEVDRALMALVAEGRAKAQAADEGGIVYVLDVGGMPEGA